MSRKKKETKPEVAQNVALTLKDIAEAPGGFIYTSRSDHEQFLSQGLVEVNASMCDDEGKIATRCTQLGFQWLEQEELEQQEKNTPWNGQEISADKEPEFVEHVVSNSQGKTFNGFKIEKDVPPPKARIRQSSNVYPFDSLEIGESFFVPNTVEKPDIAKTLSSTVSSANARYAVETGETKISRRTGEETKVKRQTRNFIVRPVEGGARIWRMK
jgi:hypothetical protein